MNDISYSNQQKNLPPCGLLALGISLFAYIFCQASLFESSVYYLGIILLITGGIQIMIGMRSHQQGNSYAAAILLPFGLFWLSIIGYEIFPKLGFGQHPDSIAMFAYLTMWTMFVAIQFLGSFRRNLTMQYLYGTLMVCLLSLSIDQLREDWVFLAIGCVFGIVAAFVAISTALTQFSEQWTGRTIFPRGNSLSN